MRAHDIIWKKREGEELSREEIEYLVKGYVAGEVPDYQMSAFCMAVYFRGMSDRELICLTTAMAASGDLIDLSPIEGKKIDKHSSGGVGDKTTILLAPLVASCGVPVAKMSGRALGHTGGTIDKLLSIPGFKSELTRDEFIGQVKRIGIAIISQTGNLAPADKKLYALRDVTATVESIPLIASSIMSKKIAAGAEGIVLDVKCGRGAFMRNNDDALELARRMVAIGRGAGREMAAVISAMDQPLGYAVGNALELQEAIAALKGEGRDLIELTLELGALMLRLAGVIRSADEGRRLLTKKIHSGEALLKLMEMIEAQGGDGEIVFDPSLLPAAPVELEVRSLKEGVILSIDARSIGLVTASLGAGRNRIDDQIDYSSGVILRKKKGEITAVGDVLAVIHGGSAEAVKRAARMVAGAYEIGEGEAGPEGVVLHRII